MQKLIRRDCSMRKRRRRAGTASVPESEQAGAAPAAASAHRAAIYLFRRRHAFASFVRILDSRMTSRLRVSAISFLNTAPLMWGFDHQDLRRQFEVHYTVPAACAQ